MLCHSSQFNRHLAFGTSPKRGTSCLIFSARLARTVIHFTGWLENTALSVWIRESPSLWAFPFILIVHAWGMGFLAGSNAAVDLRILGFAPKVPLPAMGQFYPVMWFGFVINAISGTLLLIGYPT